MKLLPGFIFRSLRIKFVLLVLGLLLFVFSISSGVLILRSINSQTNNLVSQARAYAKLTSNPIGDTYSLYFGSGYLKFAEIMNQFLVLNPDVEKIQIISVTGEILFDSEQLATNQKPDRTRKVTNQSVLEKVKTNVGGELPAQSADSRPEQIIEPYVEDFGAHPFSIRYFVSYDSISENVLATITATALLSLVFLAATILLLIFAINRSIINPIETVIRGAQTIKNGNLSHKIEVNTKDEVSDLASAVNQMATTLKKNIEDLKQLDKLKDEFVFLASHNLRTPLTAIKGYISKIQKEASFNAQTKKDVENMGEATKELETITESLINIVAMEKGQQPALVREVDLENIVRGVSEGIGQKAAKKGISFIFEFPSEPLPRIKVDEQRIRQAFANLIDNAVKFNKNGGKVTIKILRKKTNILISITDTGVGIPKEEQGKIFQKFHRATDILTYDYEGVGLGLYLSKLIIESHLGKIWFESRLGQGSTFYINLPV